MLMTEEESLNNLTAKEAGKGKYQKKHRQNWNFDENESLSEQFGSTGRIGKILSWITTEIGHMAA